MTLYLNGTTGVSGVDGSAGTPSLQGNDTNTGIVFGTDTVGVSTGGVQRTTVDSSGRLLVGVGSANANGGVLQLSGGITFPGTQVAATNVNTLDDYEEGTWAPSVGGTATYASQQGTYTKIGNLVTVSFYMTISSIGTGDTVIMSGLPFTPLASSGGGSVCYWHQTFSAVVCLLGYIYGPNPVIYFYNATGASTALGLSPIFKNATTIQGVFSYPSVA